MKSQRLYIDKPSTKYPILEKVKKHVTWAKEIEDYLEDKPEKSQVPYGPEPA